MTKSKNKTLIPDNLKSHLGASIATPLWGYQGQQTELPSAFRISPIPADLCDSLCEEKGTLQITQFSLLTLPADFTPQSELPLQHEEFLPSQQGRWHDGPEETGLCCMVPGIMCLRPWVMPPVDGMEGRERTSPTLVAASDLLCALPTWLQIQIKSPTRCLQLRMKIPPLIAKKTRPGNTADAKLRFCSCMLIYKLWTDFFMFYISFCNRKWNIDWG